MKIQDISKFIVQFIKEHDTKDEMLVTARSNDFATLLKAKAKAIAQKDPNRLKRGRTSYLIFCNDNRARITDENPYVSNKELTRCMANEWAKLKIENPTEYDSYVQRSVQERAVYMEKKLEMGLVAVPKEKKPPKEKVVKEKVEKPPKEKVVKEKVEKPPKEKVVKEKVEKPPKEKVVKEKVEKPPKEKVVKEKVEKPPKEKVVKEKVEKPPKEKVVKEKVEKPPKEKVVKEKVEKPPKEKVVKEELGVDKRFLKFKKVKITKVCSVRPNCSREELEAKISSKWLSLTESEKNKYA